MSFLIGILLLVMGPACAIAQPHAVVVGAVVSQSGALAAQADGYRKALVLWQEDINSAGGLLGRPVELRLRDDGSSAVRAGELYAQLLAEADVLIGPFGSAATLMAKAQAERAPRVLMNGAGPSAAVHARGTRHVFQSTVPYAAYGETVAALAATARLERLQILARDDPASREMGEAARQAAIAAGLDAGELALYDTGLEDFADQVSAARARSAQAWIAFGGVRDAVGMARTLKRLSYSPPFVFLSGAADPEFIGRVGQDAEYILAAQGYDPSFATPGNAVFAERFARRWGEPPGMSAAQGHAAAAVLADAARRAGSLDTEKLRTVLAQLETGTVLGGYAVLPGTGAQIAARPAVVQILKGKREVVWPVDRRTQERAPYVPWSERRLLH